MNTKTVAISPSTATSFDTRAARVLALVVLLTGAFLSPLDYFIVNLALPAIHSALHASAAQLQLIVSVYTSAFAVCLVTGGRLGDLVGRKRMFMAGMAGFVLTSLVCALAPTGGVLVGGRLAQGVSAAILVPQILATIRSVFPKEQQTKVMGLYGFVFGFASVAGQIGGGALITLQPFGLQWQSIFLINVPVGLLALVGAWRFVPESRAPHRARIDVRGLVLLSLFFALVVYPLTQGREAGWPAWTFVALAASVPALAAFVYSQRHAARVGRDPLVDLSLFRNPVFAVGLALAFCFYCDSAFFLTYGIYLQTGLGWSPLVAGLAIFPFGAGAILGPLVSPALVRRAGHHVLTVGFTALAVGFALSCVASERVVPGLAFDLGLVLAGIGHGLVLPSVVRIVVGEIEPARAGLASSIVTSMLQVGSAFGATAIGGVFFSALGPHAAAVDYAHAYRDAMAIVSALFVVCIGLAAVLSARAHGKTVRY
ncbi:MFS transporter [Trinickia acidisoli]|uniref:MFS transporter n=1 Tax=Trinickia acidisoli TaxID=2767482 RepID=UPI001A8F50D4|nr:MFS transporter [Trinickia acidisoli]